MATDWLDVALVYDPVTRRADAQLGDDGDLLLDETPITPMLITIGSDRRARPDDELPSGRSELNVPASFVERRGWAGDALDVRGDLIGCRLWLLERAKHTELTRLMTAEWLGEGFAWVEQESGRAATIEVEWKTSQILAYRVVVDSQAIALTRRI
ncbi:phage GP46 family protein [Xanthobacter autotrophicus]|uniref:phage GP46 family protein n=1 Tax=Xanthobacter TaxID=279 RepID=UPI0024AC3D2D|nr:phage GP46 family protein [Xanthobacter autotrophicus]MDI4664722.1 phage GP46 family protein [Xanthobacter autotrophicus]